VKDNNDQPYNGGKYHDSNIKKFPSLVAKHHILDWESPNRY